MSVKKIATPANVFDLITERFAEMGQPLPQKWLQFLPNGYKEVTDEGLITHICNKIFRDIMVYHEQKTGTPTFEFRVLLRDEISVSVWFTTIHDGIIPYLVQTGMMDNLNG